MLLQIVMVLITFGNHSFRIYFLNLFCTETTFNIYIVFPHCTKALHGALPIINEKLPHVLGNIEQSISLSVDGNFSSLCKPLYVVETVDISYWHARDDVILFYALHDNFFFVLLI